MVMPTTRDRVPAHTAEHINQQIRRETDERVRTLAGQPSRIAERLKQLDAEWDIERAIEANASALAFVGTALGFLCTPIGWRCLLLSLHFCSNMPCKVGVRQCQSCVA